MAMYREIVERRRAIVILMLFVVLSFIIVLYDILGNLTFGEYNLTKLSQIVFSGIMFYIIYRQIIKCKIRYKYSVMGDQLIIHKLNGKHEIIVEDVEFRDIEYIGKDKTLEEKFNSRNSRKYLCTLGHSNKCYCIYRNGGKLKKFYFEPSEKLIKKIKCNNINI